MVLTHNYIKKILWALAPLAWGGITWFLAWGPGSMWPITYEIRMLVGLLALTAFFYKTLEYERLHTKVLIFDVPLYFPDWRWLFLPSIILLIINSFFPTCDTTLLSSMTFGVFAGPFLEELLTRCFFIKYKMKGFEFIIFNCISAAAFTVMHASYVTPAPSCQALFIERGHFPFALLLGIITYKTQRIEIPIIIHMLSNFLHYTLPTLILFQQTPAWATTLFYCIQLLLLGGALGVHKKNNSTTG